MRLDLGVADVQYQGWWFCAPHIGAMPNQGRPHPGAGQQYAPLEGAPKMVSNYYTQQS